MPTRKAIDVAPSGGAMTAGDGSVDHVTADDLLVIGYGNTLRQDDGVGPRVAERLAALCPSGVRTLACLQLSPEHVELVAGAGRVIFVDASMEAGAVRMNPVLPAESARVTTHTVTPPVVLALVRDLFGRVPPAWWLTIHAVQLGFGEDLSPDAQRGIDTAVRKIMKLSGRAS